MRRDPWPIVFATATAVVSCAALTLAVWQGWLGPDVGRGATFCEAAPGLVRQPANTFSNSGFVLAGLLVAWHASRRERLGNVLAGHRVTPTAMACVIVLLGPASAAMHATQSQAGGRLDMLSMYLVASFAAAYAGMRWLRGGQRLFAGLFAAGVAGCELIAMSRAEIPVVHHAGNLAFGLLLVLAIGIEVAIMRRGRTRAVRAYAFGSIGALLLAFAIWNASQHGLCDPDSLVQGHAIWHLLCAFAAYLLYRYYASEEA